MANRTPKLTALEIEAVIAAAGNCDVPAMFEDEPDRARAARLLAAYERGMDKMQDMLALARGEA